MAKCLGANFNAKNLLTHFYHPVTNNKIYLFLDICHMVKLVRNCLGDLEELKTADKIR